MNTGIEALSRGPNRLRWTRADLEARHSWRMTLPDALLDAASRRLQCPSALASEFARLGALRELASTLRENLLGGDGVVWLQSGGRLGHLAEPVQRALFEAIGRAMGHPIDTYGTVYEVTDRGGAYQRQSIPVSQTCAATGFHTDSSQRETLPDLVGLYCLEASRTGGDSLVCSGLLAHDRLATHDESLCRRLYRSYLRDVVTPGSRDDRPSLLANRIPVFATHEGPGGLVVRYMRYWIERGHEKAQSPLAARDIAAFDALDKLLNDSELVVPLRLAPGDALWLNNRTVLHNRTEYRDDPARTRRLLRMWVDCSGGAYA
ncbi:MAG: TauD/TfdA family dioxygenase [Pseudomonadota bacterium]